MHNRLSISLEDYAPRRPGRRADGRSYNRPPPLRQETTDLDAPGTASAIEASGSIPGKKSQHLVRRFDSEHQPVWRSIPRPATTAGERAGRTDLRDAGRNLRPKK